MRKRSSARPTRWARCSPARSRSRRLAGGSGITSTRLRSVGKNGGRLDLITENIVHLEGGADDLHEDGLKTIFHRHGHSEPMAYFIAREVYGHLERVLDGFEDVANEIQGIVIDHA